MGDDACNLVKTALLAGAYTKYTSAYPIYIENKDKFQGGNVYVLLKGAFRNPVQTVDGMVLYTEKGCTVEVIANSEKFKDDLYSDIEDILTAVELAYIITNLSDNPDNESQDGLSFDVSMII